MYVCMYGIAPGIPKKTIRLLTRQLQSTGLKIPGQDLLKWSTGGWLLKLSSLTSQMMVAGNFLVTRPIIYLETFLAS